MLDPFDITPVQHQSILELSPWPTRLGERISSPEIRLRCYHLPNGFTFLHKVEYHPVIGQAQTLELILTWNELPTARELALVCNRLRKLLDIKIEEKPGHRLVRSAQASRKSPTRTNQSNPSQRVYNKSGAGDIE